MINATDKETLEVRNRDQEHTMSQSAGAQYAAIYARVSTEDQGKGISIPMQIEACQVMAARAMENWQTHANHAVPYIS